MNCRRWPEGSLPAGDIQPPAHMVGTVINRTSVVIPAVTGARLARIWGHLIAVTPVACRLSSAATRSMGWFPATVFVWGPSLPAGSSATLSARVTIRNDRTIRIQPATEKAQRTVISLDLKYRCQSGSMKGTLYTVLPVLHPMIKYKNSRANPPALALPWKNLSCSVSVRRLSLAECTY